MMLMRSTSNQNFVSLVFSLTHSGQEPDAAEITELYYVKKDTSRLAGITAGFDL